MHAIQQQYWAVRDYLSPVLRESKFREHGKITPEEFVSAGDFLAYKFPVWVWGAGDASKARDFLPAGKQYLVTRGVPCLRRATSLAYTTFDEERLLSFGDSFATGNEADEWVETHAGRRPNMDSAANLGFIHDIPDLDGPHEDDGISGAAANLSLIETPDLDDIPDMEEDLEEGDDAAATPSNAPPPPPKMPINTTAGVVIKNANLLKVRWYDVMITYDKYYQTPRIWLVGYDETGRPLVPEQILQDVTVEHAFETVTIEAFPHSTSLQAAAVQPCGHANVMQKLIERMNAGIVKEQKLQRKAGSKDGKKKWLFKRSGRSGKDDKPTGEEEEEESFRVDFYLVVFLKFFASIMPTIEIDDTTSF